MRIREILRTKRSGVVHVRPSASVGTAIDLMRREQVGAVLILDSHGELLGVVSERDVVHGFASDPIGLLDRPVMDIARRDNPIAMAHDTVQSVMESMTATRSRHVPILESGRVIAVVSIGDVVKSRLEEKTQENAILQDIARTQYFAH